MAVKQIADFLDAWAEDQSIIAEKNNSADRDWFRARSEALRDAAREIRAGAYRDGLRMFLKHVDAQGIVTEGGDAVAAPVSEAN